MNPQNKNMHGERSPHALIGIPRSLVRSQLWRNLPPGARDYYLYLLSRSNTRTFKDVFPGAFTIMADLCLNRRTMRRYENILCTAGLLKIVPPGHKDQEGITRRSRRFRFTIIKYINADYREYNEKRGSEVYEPIRDIAALEERLELMAKKHQLDITRIERRVELIEGLLDQVAQRIKITGIDEKGRVILTLYSNNYSLEFVQDALPDNVLLFPDKKNQDVIIDKQQNWNLLERRISKEVDKAQRAKKMQPLLDVLEAFENMKVAN